MKKGINAVLAAWFVGVFAVASVWAQGTAQVSGTARDQSGAVLPGVEVTATQTETGISRMTVTNETGAYALPNLPVGPYRLEAGLAGFRTFLQTGIVLQVNANPVINPVLEVGQVTEQVEVQSNVALVETRNTSVGTVIDVQRILDLPLNGRNVTDLITTTGASVSLGGETLGGRDFGGAPRLQVAGSLGYGTAYMLDGSNYLNWSAMSSLPMPFPDALQEFKVDTSGTSTDQSRGSGVSAVTKSGTNNFHGSLFEFLRNDLFNATRYFSAVDPVTGKKTHSTLKRNQFGGTIGGPIKKDKLFFFGGFQYTTIRQDPVDQQAFLPTPAMLAGDWTTFTSAACNAGRPVTLGAPFVNNRIDPAQYSPAGLRIAQRILAGIPAPPDACGLVRFSRPNPTNEWEPVVRVDYQRSDKQTIFGRWNAHHFYAPRAFTLRPDNLLTSTAAGNDGLIQGYVLGDTYLFGPSVVNAFRLSVTRQFNAQLGTKFFNACDVGINVYCGYVPERLVLLGSNGSPSIGSGMGDGDSSSTQNHQIDEDLSIVRGTHQYSIGGNLRFTQAHIHDNFLDAPRFTINGSVTGNGLSDLMTGRLPQMVAAAPYYVSVLQWGTALYAGDVWKMRPKVTMSYGLRWEPFLPQRLMEGKGIAEFNLGRYNAGTKSTVFPNAPAGWYYAGDPGIPGETGMKRQWALFAPRLGLAWDPNGDGKTSLRASYSYSYTAVGFHWRDDPSQQGPWGNTTRVANASLDNPWNGFPGGNPFPLRSGTAAQFVPFGDYQSLQTDLATPVTSAWNLTLQRQIGTDWLVSASYLGSLTTHIWIQDAINPSLIVPSVFPLGTCPAGVTTGCNAISNTSQRRKFTLQNPNGAQMGNTALLESTATMNYHGMLVSAQKRLSQNFSIQANYTWSHCIGDFVDLTSGGPDAGEVNTKPGDRGFDRGDCNGDRRHLWNSTVLVRTPRFSGNMLGKVASNWSLAGSYRWSSGQPLDVRAGADRALNGSVGLVSGTSFQRADQLSAAAYGDKTGRPFSNWLNRAAFALPAFGTLGNFRRNSVVAPATWSFDVGLSRQLPITERQRFEVRVEAFNLTNSFRPNGAQINVTAGNGLFGQIRDALDPRILQLALKYAF